jgi:monoamine oxidase
MSVHSISRRQFLRRLGAASGSTAVLGALSALELTAAPGGVRPNWPATTRNARVLVLGAGLSGMATAYELGKLGYDVQVLEARNRVGGVSHTIRRGTSETELTGEHQECNFDDGLYLNAGPWRIPHTHAPTVNYCKELGVALQIFINEHDASYLYYEDPAIGPLSGKKVRLREVKADMRGHTAEILAKVLNQDLLDLPLTAQDTELLVSYLIGEGYLDSTDKIYRGGTARGTEPPFDLSALLQSGFANRVRSVDSGTARAPVFQPIGGMDQLPFAFQRALGNKIVLGAAVKTIRQQEDGVRVVYTNTSTGVDHEVTADYVVSCIPMSVLTTLDTDLSPAMAALVAAVPYSDSTKIGIQMRRRFWEEDDGIFGGMAYTNLPIGQFGYPSNDFYSKKGVLLGFYGSGSTAGINQLPLKDRIAHVVNNAAKFHPQARDEFETGYAVFWEKIRYSNGAIARSQEAQLAPLSEPDRRLYVGCAGVSNNPGWMEGAFRAAWGTVDKIHRRVMA